MIESENIKTIGGRLLTIRIILNLTQYELAKYLEVSQFNISRIENNKSLLDSDQLVKLYNLFDINLEWLLIGNGAMFISKD
jgi:transcriptional regulator with XRE-family HTH domain